MASRWAIGTTFLVFMLAACRAPVQPSISERTTGGSKSRVRPAASAPAVTSAPASLTVTIQGATPEIVSRYGTSASVPTGGVPVAAPNAPQYALAQAVRFVPVPQAEVTVTDPAGRTLAARGLRTDATGAVRLPKIVTKSPLIILRAAYLVSGRRAVLSAVLPTPQGDGQTTVDPATTLVAKRLETLGRMREVDLMVFPPDLPAKLAVALATQLTEQEIAAIGLLDPEPAARLLDARLETDVALRDALTAAAGAGGAITAFIQPLPRITSPTASGAPLPARSLRPDEIDALPTTLPTLDVSLAPLTPEPSPSPSPLAVSAPPSKPPSVAPSPALSPSPSLSPALSPSPSASPSASPEASPEASPSASPEASIEPSVSPSPSASTAG